MAMAIDTPYIGPDTRVRDDWIDYNGHMNVGYYHVAFDLASEPFFAWLGLDRPYRESHHASTFALESHLHFLREVKAGDPLRFEAQLIDFDYKRIHFFQRMFHAEQGYLAATYESLSSHVDMRSRRTSAMAGSLQARLAEVLAAHRTLPAPPQLGHRISAHPPR